MTMREKIEISMFGAILVIALPALLVFSRGAGL